MNRLVVRFDDAHHSYHANSIEKVFGMARSMVTLIAKVNLSNLNRIDLQVLMVS